MSRKQRAIARELKVVFDTNALHTQAVSDLVSADTRELIEANSKHSDLTITWYVPEVVILERHYQMLQKATELLRNFQKMDALLDFKISLTPEQLPPKIESLIAAQVDSMGISRLPLDHSLVGWAELIKHAALRIAPFQPGDAEKGFRDAVILETFMQLVESAPRSPAHCRLALVTRDGNLSAAAKSRLAAYGNAEVLPGLAELRELINTLISTVDEAYVHGLRERAGELFFQPEKKDTIIYRERVIEQIREKFKSQLNEIPTGADLRENPSIMVGTPRFIKKDRQRVYWATEIEFTASAYKYDAPLPSLGDALGGSSAGLGGLAGTNALVQPAYFTLGGLMSTREKKLVKQGASNFNVAWSTTVDKNKKLKAPTVDGISIVGTTWE
jgi:hypothetical protein